MDNDNEKDAQDGDWKGKAAIAGAAIGSAALAAALLYANKRKDGSKKSAIKPASTTLPPETD